MLFIEVRFQEINLCFCSISTSEKNCDSGISASCGEIRLTLFSQSDTKKICINVNNAVCSSSCYEYNEILFHEYLNEMTTVVVLHKIYFFAFCILIKSV